MNRPRFLADHDLNEHIIYGVLRREPTVEFIRAHEVDMHDKSDPEILAFAAGQGFLLVSHDVNTMPSHAYARMSSGQAVARVLTTSAHLTKRTCSIHGTALTLEAAAVTELPPPRDW